jgi:AcrR family transcriptional regulator
MPLFAERGLHGVSVRELAKAAGTNVSMISYHFGGKLGLYEAVLRQVFHGMLQSAQLAEKEIASVEKFKGYLLQCGICFHAADQEEFTPRTASADPATPECPHCLNNDADSFERKDKE